MPIVNAAFQKSAVSYPKLVHSIRSQLQSATQALQQIKVTTYWNVGRLIETFRLKNQSRITYGKEFYWQLSKDLKLNERILRQTVQFYRSFPKFAANPQLAWTHYRELLKVEDANKRQGLLKKVGRLGLSTRALQKEIKALKFRQSAAGETAQFDGAPGKLYTYRLDTPRIAVPKPGYRVADCGFGLWRQVPAEGFAGVADGAIVESKTSESRFYLIKSARSQEDLHTYRAGLDYVIDGDTVVMHVDLGFRSWTRQKLRLRGIDTPEIGAPQGQKAKAFVEEQLKQTKGIVIKTYRKDKYGRYLADIFLGPKQTFLNQKLLDEHLATLYNG